ncbi:MAG: M20/M25/M40 family metallo-hydrolase [Chloroflexota bacterium]
MDLERLIARTRALQAIPAPTFSEADRGEWLRSEFEECRLVDVTVDTVGNVLARIPGRGPGAVVVSAHLDTVFPHGTDLTARRDADRLWGPGIGDNALGLAALAELGLDLSAAPPPCDVCLAATVGEEGLGNLRGMTQVVQRFRLQAKAYIVVEGMSLGTIYHRSLPIRRLRLEARAPGGHAWTHAGRPSAAHALLRLGAELLRLPRPDPRKPSLNIGRIEGGTSINTIAAQAAMEIDLRCEDRAMLEAFLAEVRRVIDVTRQQGADIRWESVGDRPGGSIPEEHPLVQSARAALLQAGVEEVQLEVGSTDATVPLSQGLPAVCVGLTHGGGTHSLSENIELEPIPRGYQALLTLVRAVCAMDLSPAGSGTLPFVNKRPS